MPSSRQYVNIQCPTSTTTAWYISKPILNHPKQLPTRAMPIRTDGQKSESWNQKFGADCYDQYGSKESYGLICQYETNWTKKITTQMNDGLLRLRTRWKLLIKQN